MATLDQDDLDAIAALLTAYGAAKPGDQMDLIDDLNGSAVTSMLNFGVANNQDVKDVLAVVRQSNRNAQISCGGWTDVVIASQSGLDGITFTMKSVDRNANETVLGAWDVVNGWVKKAEWTDPLSYHTIPYLTSVAGTCADGSHMVIRGVVPAGGSNGGASTFTIRFPALDAAASGDFVLLANGALQNWEGGAMSPGLLNANVTQIAGDTTSATNLMNSTKTIYVGSVTGAANATTLIDSTLTQTAVNHWVGRIILFTTGVLKYEATDITGFDPVLDQLTFSALTGAPGLGDAYVIV